jgi:hypothetical protein
VGVGFDLVLLRIAQGVVGRFWQSYDVVGHVGNLSLTSLRDQGGTAFSVKGYPRAMIYRALLAATLLSVLQTVPALANGATKIVPSDAAPTYGSPSPVTRPRMCEGFGPQAPRDIALVGGGNNRRFSIAPPAAKLNLCNIHFHAQAEHKGPGFDIYAGQGDNGGWQCNGTPDLSAAELGDPGPGACGGVKPGDSIEVHWVHSSCDVAPGEGLGSCMNESCKNPQLRVETQVFLVVNDPKALDFTKYDHNGPMIGGVHQAKTLPKGTGDPVTYLGSTTGPDFSQQICSPYQVTWSVRPQCAKVDIASLHRWCAGNSSREDHAHGVRHLVTAPTLLAPIQ